MLCFLFFILFLAVLTFCNGHVPLCAERQRRGSSSITVCLRVLASCPQNTPPPVPREERRRAWWLWPPFPSPSVFRPSTPPPKPVAFEDFKNERGSEINRIFKENKSILNERRKRASETTQRINAIKREMDMTKEALNFQKSLREKQGECWWEGGWGLWELSHPALNGAVLSPGGWRWEGAGGACGGVVFTPVSSCGSNQP